VEKRAEIESICSHEAARGDRAWVTTTQEARGTNSLQTPTISLSDDIPITKTGFLPGKIFSNARFNAADDASL
jgi:hypothetical protein